MPKGTDSLLDLFETQEATRRRLPPDEAGFSFVPSSVFDARQGKWQDRKRAWASVGIRGEVGRDAAVLNCPTNAWKDGDWEDDNYTSIFDPALCEASYRWFSAPGAQIVDPFAGGSVRGIVAGMLGRKYWGCDLRQEQIDANEAQAEEIQPEIRPHWVCGDSSVMLDHAPEADLIFSCPPYGDLEQYSDDPRDLSYMDWNQFMEVYDKIIAKSVQSLKPDRFAVFVVGDFRDKKTGIFRDFVGATKASFRNAGAELYNDAILLTVVASASMRVRQMFDAGRKFARTHQNVLVFCKGDWKKATEAAGGFLSTGF